MTQFEKLTLKLLLSINTKLDKLMSTEQEVLATITIAQQAVDQANAKLALIATAQAEALIESKNSLSQVTTLTTEVAQLNAQIAALNSTVAGAVPQSIANAATALATSAGNTLAAVTTASTIAQALADVVAGLPTATSVV